MNVRGIIGSTGPTSFGRHRRPALSAVLVLTVALVTGCGGGVSGSAEPAVSSGTTSSTAAPTPAAPTTAAPLQTTAPSTPSRSTPAPTAPSSATTSPSTSSATGSASPGTPAPGTTPSGTDLSGEVYGFVRSVDLGTLQLTLDKVDWFTGGAAAQACAQDGVTEHDNGWCTMYYYRNVNPRLRTVPVSAQATITILDGSQDVAGDPDRGERARCRHTVDRSVPVDRDGRRGDRIAPAVLPVTVLPVTVRAKCAHHRAALAQSTNSNTCWY